MASDFELGLGQAISRRRKNDFYFYIFNTNRFNDEKSEIVPFVSHDFMLVYAIGLFFVFNYLFFFIFSVTVHSLICGYKSQK